jgi:hypothetical protein
MMDPKTAKSLVESLLERMEADAASSNPRFAGLVSASERAAIGALLAPSSAKEQTNDSPEHLTGNAPSPSPVEGSSRDPELGSLTSPARNVPEQQHQATRPPSFAPSVLDETALSFKEPQDSSYVLCLDFGTAKSKAAASSFQGDDDHDPTLFELGLGRRDHDLDSSAYTLSSSVWISDDGKMFAGSEALRQSIDYVLGDSSRRRLDSIKHQLSLANVEQNLDRRLLEPDVNPSRVDLTYEDALCFFLAFLTDTAADELAEHGCSRYVRRRFTIPSWRPEQRSWAALTLGQYLGRAQLLADTFRGRWRAGIPVAEFKTAVGAAKKYDNATKYLLDESYAAGRPFPSGLLEPLAAGSGRIWADRSTRNLMLVVDVGAGTTDFSLFWVVQDAKQGSRRAFPVYPCSDAVRMAGDIIDDLLLKQILGRAHSESNDVIRKRMEADLRLRGIRRLKERLFDTGKLEVPLVTDQIITIEREEFEELPQFQAISGEIEKAIATFLGAVHATWSRAAERTTLVLTGGSAKLPIIQRLAEKNWKIAGQPIALYRAKEIPDLIAETFDADFQREYGQLAVAIGGALPVLDERTTLTEWAGGAIAPGGLERFQITGV